MVSVTTNRPAFQNDIAEVVRVYLSFVDIELSNEKDSAFHLQVTLYPNHAPIVNAAIYQSGQLIFSYSYPIADKTESAMIKKRFEKRSVKIAVFRALAKLYPDQHIPWGSLTGIRPTKLFRELVLAEGREEARRLFAEEFDVRADKTALVSEITTVQAPILQQTSAKSVNVYIGIPFCRTRCLYCSFASQLADKDGVPQEYLDALFEDIYLGAQMIREGGYRVRSMYVGGGTPTVLSADQLARLLKHAQACYGGYGEELTVEAGRPDTISKEKLQIMQALGIGRISLNPQTMQEKTLHLIGRQHTPQEIIESFKLARELGFENINMDMIVGLPGEGEDEVRRTLEAITRLGPDSLTVHTLAIKRSSQLKGKLHDYPLPESEEMDRILRHCADCARDMKMRPYYMYRQKYMRGNLENTGYAKQGKECVYNIEMMEESANIMAHGAGSMSKRVFVGRDLRVERIPAPKDIKTYIEKYRILHEKKRDLYMQA